MVTMFDAKNTDSPRKVTFATDIETHFASHGKSIETIPTEVELSLYAKISELLALDHKETQDKKNAAKAAVIACIELAQENSTAGLHEHFKNYIYYAIQHTETFSHDNQKLLGMFNQILNTLGADTFGLKEIENITNAAQNKKSPAAIPLPSR